MEYFVNVKKSLGYFADSRPFYLLDREELAFAFPAEENIKDCIVHFSNGKKTATIRTNLSKSVLVPSELLIGGELNVSVDVLVKGIVARKITIEPLSLIETETETVVFPEIELLNKQIEELAEMVVGLKNRIERAEQEIECLQEAVEQ